METIYTIGKHKLTLRKKITPQHLAAVKKMMGIETMRDFTRNITTMANAQAFVMDVVFDQSQFSEFIKTITGTEEEILISEIDDMEVIGRMATDFFARCGLNFTRQ